MKSKEQNIILADEIVVNKIFFIREQKVMLDRDLAELYGVKTKRLKEQVRRNIERFPASFMFELNSEENDSLRSQNASLKRGEHSKYLPYAFTEHGILMLANVLKSKRAIQMSIRIIVIFVRMREMLFAHKDLLLKVQQLEKTAMNHDEKIKQIFGYLKQILTPPKVERKRIGYKRYDEK